MRSLAASLTAGALIGCGAGASSVPEPFPRSPLVEEAEERSREVARSSSGEDDTDGDGIADVADLCTTEPEDVDDFEDDDGCVDPDNDQDQIADVDDACPNEPETYNGQDDGDGCPDHARVVIRTAGVVRSPERIYFPAGSSQVPTIARPILDAIADVLGEYPDITLVEIAGHSDGQGTLDARSRISRARADEVVRELVARGVEPDRLRAIGYGAACPIAPEVDAEARERNRRVELHVIRRRDSEEETPSPCPAPEGPSD